MSNLRILLEEKIGIETENFEHFHAKLHEICKLALIAPFLYLAINRAIEMLMCLSVPNSTVSNVC